MLFFAFTIFLALGVRSALLLPPPVVTLCTEASYLGNCSAILVNTTYDETRPSTPEVVNVQGVACYNLQEPFVGNVSSFSVTNGTACYLNHQKNCSDVCMSPSGCNEIVEYPGYANLSIYGYPAWTDYIGSFSCAPEQ